MKKRKPIIFILIAISLVILYVVIVSIINASENLEKEYMLDDAKHMLLHGEIKLAENALDEDNNVICLQIYGYEGKYNNSGNYIGSVDLSEQEPYIELSDGKYYVTGTMKNLSIIKSNLNASTTCN